jgi:hypothetical protein
VLSILWDASKEPQLLFFLASARTIHGIGGSSSYNKLTPSWTCRCGPLASGRPGSQEQLWVARLLLWGLYPVRLGSEPAAHN